MMFKKRSVDQSAINQLREELAFVNKYDVDSKTEAGQHLIELLEFSIEDTIKKFITEDIDKFDSDTKIIVFFSACRSKLQTLFALKNIYEGAELKRRQLSDELEKIISNP